MYNILDNISQILKTMLPKADEIWVAVALINYDGYQFIQKHINRKCKQHYIIGIDLPTDPKVLNKLYRYQHKTFINARIFNKRKIYYHPKLYILRTKGSYNVIVGSSNCTNGGLFDNIEINIHISNNIIADTLINWFNEFFEDASPITSSFIREYKEIYKKRKKRNKDEEYDVSRVKNKENKKMEVKLKNKKMLISELKRWRKTQNYKEIRDGRSKEIRNIKKSLNYPYFEDIDIDQFYDYWSLGHLIPVHKPRVKRQLSKLKKMLHFLCDDKIDIIKRYDESLKGKYSIYGVSDNFISKVLTIHNPKEYYLENKRSISVLKKYGLELPRGLSDGEKYYATSEFLKRILKETKIANFAILDHYLYIKSNE